MTKNSKNIAATATVVQSDKLEADLRHREERLEAFRKVATADDLAGSALVGALLAVAMHGATSKAEVAEAWPTCNNPDVYASYFNSADKVQKLIGLKATVDLITTAASTGGGAGFTKAREALAHVIRDAKAQGVKELKPAAARMAVKAAVQAATAPKPKTAKGAQGQRSGTMSAAKAATVGEAAIRSSESPKAVASALRLISQNAHRLPEPEGRSELFRVALKALEDAAEAWAPFIR